MTEGGNGNPQAQLDEWVKRCREHLELIGSELIDGRLDPTTAGKWMRRAVRDVIKRAREIRRSGQVPPALVSQAITEAKRAFNRETTRTARILTDSGDRVDEALEITSFRYASVDEGEDGRARHPMAAHELHSLQKAVDLCRERMDTLIWRFVQGADGHASARQTKRAMRRQARLVQGYANIRRETGALTRKASRDALVEIRMHYNRLTADAALSLETLERSADAAAIGSLQYLGVPAPRPPVIRPPPTPPRQPRAISGRRGTPPPGAAQQDERTSWPPQLRCRSSQPGHWEVFLVSDTPEGGALTTVTQRGRSVTDANGIYTIQSFRDPVDIASDDGREHQLALFGGTPLVFRFGKDWDGVGIQMRALTRGHFLVLAPKEWTRTGHVPHAPERCADGAFRAHFFFVDAETDQDPETRAGFLEQDGSLYWERIGLSGHRVVDNSQEGPLFGGPGLSLDARKHLESARVGEERKDGWGQNFRPQDRSLSSVLGNREGRFFLRVYDGDAVLLDSVDFRYLHDLAEIRVNGRLYGHDTLLVPSSGGHLPSKIDFIGFDGQPAPLTIERIRGHGVGEGDDGGLMVPARPESDHVSVSLRGRAPQGRGRAVGVIVALPRVWWRVDAGTGDEETEWRDTPLKWSRSEFRRRARAGASVWLIAGPLRSVDAGFGGEPRRDYARSADQGQIVIPLRDFGDYSVVEEGGGGEAIWFNVRCGEETLPLIRLPSELARAEWYALRTAPGQEVAVFRRIQEAIDAGRAAGGRILEVRIGTDSGDGDQGDGRDPGEPAFEGHVLVRMVLDDEARRFIDGLDDAWFAGPGQGPHPDTDTDARGRDSLEGGLRKTDADPVPYVRLVPSGDGLRVSVRVRPLPGAELFFDPGLGEPRVSALQDGQRIVADRDLEAERQALAALARDCPRVAGIEAGASLEFADREQCLELVEELKAAGARCLWPKGELFNVVGRVDADSLQLSMKTIKGWLVASGTLVVDEERVLELSELLRQARDPTRYVRMDDGSFVALSDTFKNQLADLGALSTENSGGGRRMNGASALALSELIDAASPAGDAAWRFDWLRHKEALQWEPRVPAGFKAKLRPYQEEGFRWLARRGRLGVGACLADDMGLGKTVQTLALLLERAPEGPALVVAPTSVVANWKDEAGRFAPTLNVRTFAGPVSSRAPLLEDLGPFDVVVTTYNLLSVDADSLADIAWSTAVLDEAQEIRNFATQKARAARRLNADFRVATTGTPMQNNLMDLYSLFAFLNPGLLGSLKRFRERFVLPVERDGDTAGTNLGRLIQPFVRRRLKTEVLADLPPRTEVPRKVEMSTEEASLYEALRRRAVEDLEALSDDGAASGTGRMQALAHLTKLRLACCNPRLVELNGWSGRAPASSKLAAFAETLDELRGGNHKVLVFSQFVRHLKLVEEHLAQAGIPYQYLDGSTPARAREERVKAFQAGDGDAFLISLKAGGTGLNLTAANYVIHMDPWWNPAAEDQASDRAHRIGQTKEVTVYKLITVGTIEEKILGLQSNKRRLASQVLADATDAARLSTGQLLELLREHSRPESWDIAEDNGQEDRATKAP